MKAYIAAGIFVLGATALAWFWDRQTAEERKSQEDLASSNERARVAINAVSSADAHTQGLVREEQGRRLAAEYAAYCRQFRERLETPAKEFDELARRLDQDFGRCLNQPLPAQRIAAAQRSAARYTKSAKRLFCLLRMVPAQISFSVTAASIPRGDRDGSAALPTA